MSDGTSAEAKIESCIYEHGIIQLHMTSYDSHIGVPLKQLFSYVNIFFCCDKVARLLDT